MAVNQRPRYSRFRARLDQEPQEIITISGDGAIPIDVDRNYLLTKGSPAAITIAAPGAAGVGRRITITSGSAFAHIITFTGGTMRGGTAATATATLAAQQGAGVSLLATSATTWAIVANMVATLA